MEFVPNSVCSVVCSVLCVLSESHYSGLRLTQTRPEEWDTRGFPWPQQQKGIVPDANFRATRLLPWISGRNCDADVFEKWGLTPRTAGVLDYRYDSNVAYISAPLAQGFSRFVRKFSDQSRQLRTKSTVEEMARPCEDAARSCSCRTTAYSDRGHVGKLFNSLFFGELRGCETDHDSTGVRTLASNQPFEAKPSAGHVNSS